MGRFCVAPIKKTFHWLSKVTSRLLWLWVIMIGWKKQAPPFRTIVSKTKFLTCSDTSQVVYYLQWVYGKSAWKVNGTRLFGSFCVKISRSNGTFEKIVLFFRTEHCKRRFVLHFFKAIFDTSLSKREWADYSFLVSSLGGRFLVNGADL